MDASLGREGDAKRTHTHTHTHTHMQTHTEKNDTHAHPHTHTYAYSRFFLIIDPSSSGGRRSTTVVDFTYMINWPFYHQPAITLSNSYQNHTDIVAYLVCTRLYLSICMDLQFSTVSNTYMEEPPNQVPCHVHLWSLCWEAVHSTFSAFLSIYPSIRLHINCKTYIPLISRTHWGL